MISRLTLLIASLVATATAGAQTAPTPTTRPDTGQLDPVVVTATRSSLPLSRVPASVTVLDGATLRAQGITLVADALRTVPGVSIVQSGSYGAQTSLFLRGGQNNYTKVLVDGVPVNDPGGYFDWASLTLDDVERIEVLRGPASVLYGSDAVSGVIQIFTKRGAAGMHGSVAARGGTYDSYDVSGSLQGLAGSRLPVSYSLGGGHHASAGIYDFNSAYRNAVGSGSLTVAPWREAELRLTGRYTDLDAHYPTDFTGAPVDPNAFRTEKRTVVGTELRQALGRGVEANLAWRSNLSDAAIDDPANDPSGTNSRYLTHNRRQSAELRLAVPVAAAVTLTGGLANEVEAQGSASSEVSAQTGTGPTSSSWYERRSTGAFAQLLSTVGATTATVGGRYDHSNRFGNFSTYRVALSQRVAAATRLRGSVGTAFREPSIAEFAPSPYNTGNPDLRPERTASWELGAEQDLLAGRVTLGATWFAQRFSDLIDYQSSSYPGHYENIARAHANGAEVELRALPTAHVTADASLTYLDTRVERRGFSAAPDASLVEGGRLLRRPMHSASAGIGYHAPRRAGMDLRVVYVGPREDRLFHGAPTYSTENVTLAGYTKVDLSGEIPLLGDRAALTARIENLLGADYQQVAGYASPGRAVYGGARVRF